MSTTLTPEQRSIRAPIGAFALHAQGGTSTGAGTRAFLSRFVAEVVAAAEARGETLTLQETERRAQMARKAYFGRLALASSRSRTKKAGQDDQRPQPANGEGTRDAHATA
jgi:hypothetical protein